MVELRSLWVLWVYLKFEEGVQSDYVGFIYRFLFEWSTRYYGKRYWRFKTGKLAWRTECNALIVISAPLFLFWVIGRF